MGKRPSHALSVCAPAADPLQIKGRSTKMSPDIYLKFPVVDVKLTSHTRQSRGSHQLIFILTLPT